jgi:TonB family protein
LRQLHAHARVGLSAISAEILVIEQECRRRRLLKLCERRDCVDVILVKDLKVKRYSQQLSTAWIGRFLLVVLCVAAELILAKPVELTKQESNELVPHVRDPAYPNEAREKGQSGPGIVMLTIDTTTGHVVKAEMLLSTHSKILDQAAIQALREWRFKPGTVSKVWVPIKFFLSGNSAIVLEYPIWVDK